LFLLTTSVFAANIYVNHNGNDSVASASGYVLAATGKTVTKTGAFANYVYNSGDVFQVVSGTGATPGYYTIASRTSANAIVLATSAGDCANATCVFGNDGTTETTTAGTLHGPYRTIKYAAANCSSGDTILIKADQNYVMNGTDQPAATIDVNHNPCTIRGYYLTVGDQDAGGAYYKNVTHGWVVIDVCNGGWNALGMSGISDISNVGWCNLKTINASGASYYIGSIDAGQYGYLLQNCWITGSGSPIGAIVCDVTHGLTVRDCKFTGTYSGNEGDNAIIQAIDAVSPGALVVEFCEFNHGDAPTTILSAFSMSIIHDNIFNISGAVPAIINLNTDGEVYNNIIYEGSGGNITTGILLNTKYSAVYNNIIVGCTTSINENTGGSAGGYNCLYNNGANWTLRYGDITTNPQFVDATNGDFRLKPTSPCINTGKPIYYPSGKTSMGAWQPGFSDVFGGI
jgi:hypothetical protein